MRSILFLVALIPGSSLPARLQEPPSQTKDNVRVAHEFLTSLYPDLSGKGYIMTLESSSRFDGPANDRYFDLYVGRGPKDEIIGYVGGYPHNTPPSANSPTGPIHPEQLLESSFQFGENGRLTSFAARGPALKPDKYVEIISLVPSSPDMKDAEVEALLKQAGAMYGPSDKDVFVKHLPMDKLQRFLGPLEVTSVEFPVPDANGLRIGWPEWRVLAKAKNGSSSEPSYKMTFEPFKGDLVGLSVLSMTPNSK